MIDSLAIGRFDGIHLGHRALFERLTKDGAILAIETGRSNLTPPEFIDKYVDKKLVFYRLEEIKDLDALGFLKKLKNDFPDLKKIVVGEDFRFAKDRAAGVDELQTLWDGEVEVVPELRIEGIGVHSKYIRTLILDGNVERAAIFLGREYEIFGKKIKGQGIGAQKLVATINLDASGFLLPNEGVYISKIQISDRCYPSVTFVGHRVSTDGNFAVDTHIIGKFIDSENERYFLSFVKKIRGNKYFDSLSALKETIDSDIRQAENFFWKMLK